MPKKEYTVGPQVVKDFVWWPKGVPNKHIRLFDAFRHIHNMDQTRRKLDLDHMRLYGNLNVLGFSPSQFYEHKDRSNLALNVIRAVADTVVSQVARQKPRPVFLTDAGNRSLQRKSRLLTRFVEGQFYLSNIHQIGPRVMLDACVFGTGALKVFRRGKKICLERTFPGELFVDQAEGIYQKPRNLYQRKFINRDVLKGMFPEHTEAIDKVTPVADREGFFIDTQSIGQMIEVLEAWHLPNEMEQKDGSHKPVGGKHAISIDNQVLYEEEWKHSDFPFIFIRWSDGILGFWGQGLAEELTGIQVEINKILRKIQQAFHRLAVPWILVEQGSQVQKAHLNNDIGAVIPYRGSPPVVKPNQTMSPEVFAHLQWLYARAFDHVGVSQMAAMGQKPAGTSSGIAIQEAMEVQFGRFAIRVRSYEELHLEAARWVVRLGREIAEEYPDYTVVAARDRYTVENVPWKEVDLDEDAYVLKVFASSSLPQEPSGRIQKVIELINSGMIDIQKGRELLDFPDLEAEMALDRAASDNIERMIEAILDEGRPQTPEPTSDLQLFIKRAQSAYEKAKVMETVPRDRLAMLRNAIMTAATMQKLAMAEQQMMQAPLGQASPLPAGPAGAPPAAPQPGDGFVPQ
jgi:hypothetical protein